MIKKDQTKKVKVNPSVQLDIPLVQASLKDKCIQEEVKTELKSEGVIYSIIREENLPLSLATVKSSVKDGCQLESQCPQMTLDAQSPSKKGKLIGSCF